MLLDAFTQPRDLKPMAPHLRSCTLWSRLGHGTSRLRLPPLGLQWSGLNLQEIVGLPELAVVMQNLHKLTIIRDSMRFLFDVCLKFGQKLACLWNSQAAIGTPAPSRRQHPPGMDVEQRLSRNSSNSPVVWPLLLLQAATANLASLAWAIPILDTAWRSSMRYCGYICKSLRYFGSREDHFTRAFVHTFHIISHHFTSFHSLSLSLSFSHCQVTPLCIDGLGLGLDLRFSSPLAQLGAECHTRCVA